MLNFINCTCWQQPTVRNKYAGCILHKIVYGSDIQPLFLLPHPMLYTDNNSTIRTLMESIQQVATCPSYCIHIQTMLPPGGNTCCKLCIAVGHHSSITKELADIHYTTFNQSMKAAAFLLLSHLTIGKWYLPTTENGNLRYGVRT